MANKKNNGKNAVKKSVKKSVKKTTNKTVKKTAAVAKKHTGLTVFLIILLVILIAGFFIGEYFFGWIGLFKGDDGDDFGIGGEIAYESDELAIHFLELGNKHAGDCTLIDIGDTEILIDAGSRQGSAATIVPYINQYCDDGVLEYVVATHAHQDHIAAFVGTAKNKGIFESFECETIIDFPRTDVEGKSDIYSNYIAKRGEAVAAGSTHYTALECWNNENGAQRVYQITADITLSVLYNYYYEHSSDDENNYSVCLLLTYKDQNFLFTGDLEEDGEKRLVSSGKNSLPKCNLFKGGHHGSYTSSTKELLSVIQPDIVCVCCCAGTDEYSKNKDRQFPSQDFINRVGAYTDSVYVTSVISDNADGYTSMNGNIAVISNGTNIRVMCSNNTTKLKDTAWFKDNRTWP